MLGLLVAGFWEGVRGIIGKVIRRPVIFACCCSMSIHIFPGFLTFFFFGF